MSRINLLNDIRFILEGYGYSNNPSKMPFTYQEGVRYPSEIQGKKDTAHFLVHTQYGTVQIVAKYQQVNGTAIEKLGHTAFDAARTEHDHFIVVCGGRELVRKAISYLNNKKAIAPKLQAMEVHELEDFLSDLDASHAA